MARTGEVIEVGVREARANFARYLNLARAGASVRIVARDAAPVELRAAPEAAAPRRLGFMRGKIHLKPGWDDDVDPEDFDCVRESD
jgi:antitoxin (DNA-binding transcriptional repressor) of toxin-antitoxin stability system